MTEQSMITGYALWIDRDPLILASTSATRLQLVQAAGIAVEARNSAIDEREVEKEHRVENESAEAIALLLAREKALAVSRREPGRLVLGADQTLACDGHKFDKPANMEAARSQILALSGRTHYLHSAGVLARDGVPVFSVVSTAGLAMPKMSSAFVDRYLASIGEAALRSVGGYQLEGLGVQLFSNIEGDYFTILGLPLLPLLQALRELGSLMPLEESVQT